MTLPSNLPTDPIDEDATQIKKLVLIGLLTRILVDTGTQIFFPFLPMIAAGLGVTEVVAGRLVSLRSMTGLAAPLFGAWADRSGYRLVMRFGLALAAVGFTLIGLSNNIWLAMVGVLLAGVGGYSFVPNLQAYLSNMLPYHRRARGIGILEYAWALAGIVGLFLVGQLIALTSWRVPFFVLGGGLFITAVLYAYLPGREARPAPHIPSTASASRRFRAFFDLGLRNRSAYFTIGIAGLVMYAALNLFITYGTWLSREYGLQASALGTVALIMGLSDLSGSVSVSLFTDKFGKRRSVYFGSGTAAFFFAVLPLFNQSLFLAVGGLILARALFEFTVVANLTLLSEQVATQRAKVMTLAAALATLGTAVAGFTGPWLYETGGITAVGLVSAVALALASFVAFFGVREPDEDVV